MTPEQRSKAMASVGSKHTAPEIAVRKYLHRLGLRYSLHPSDLPGTPDVALRRRRAAVFVHGCFWHRCPHCRVGRQKIRTNLDYWLPKLTRNKARDKRAKSALSADGWRVFVVWECQTKSAPILRRLGRQLLRLKASPPSTHSTMRRPPARSRRQVAGHK